VRAHLHHDEAVSYQPSASGEGLSRNNCYSYTIHWVSPSLGPRSNRIDSPLAPLGEGAELGLCPLPRGEGFDSDLCPLCQAEDMRGFRFENEMVTVRPRLTTLRCSC
jgi:hypothetical protein